MQLIFMGILENFLHPKAGANTKDFCRQYQVKLDPKLAPNLPNLQLFIYKLTKLIKLMKFIKTLKFPHKLF